MESEHKVNSSVAGAVANCYFPEYQPYTVPFQTVWTYPTIIQEEDNKYKKAMIEIANEFIAVEKYKEAQVILNKLEELL